MPLHADYQKHTLRFRFDAGTSRGTLTEKRSYFIRIRDTAQPDVVGWGECGPLRGLSLDDRPDFEPQLAAICTTFNQLDLELFPFNVPIILNQLVSQQLPSVLFGMETAMLDFLAGGRQRLFDNAFSRGEESIPINGLVWMGSAEFMRQQIEEKLAAGFTTLKLKVGALDFAQECRLLADLRARFGPDQLTLRVDANGAWTAADAPEKLAQLAEFHLHSIEQPIRAGQPDALAELCQQSPVPVALDEELIGCMAYDEKFRLLKRLQPPFIVLKPTLLGGLHHCDEWIELATRLGIGWWITSALESNVGLNAIAQHAAQHKLTGAQGLGTGQLYHNNVASPLFIDHGALHHHPAGQWGLDGIGQ